VVHDGIIPDALSLSQSIKKVALDHLSAWKGLSSSPTEIWLPLQQILSRLILIESHFLCSKCSLPRLKWKNY
jgi:hypothetical protein